MKKLYSIGLLLLVLVMVGAVFAACGSEDTTTTTAAPATTTTAAPATPTTAAGATDTTAAAGGQEIGIYFEDMGNNVVKITDVPAPGLAFPVVTSGDMAAKIEAFDAAGKSLGALTTDTGELDYSAVAANVAKIVVTGPTGTVSEYAVPAK
jgi:type IV pilus biogenesis protein CpaD/CtpE